MTDSFKIKRSVLVIFWAFAEVFLAEGALARGSTENNGARLQAIQEKPLPYSVSIVKLEDEAVYGALQASSQLRALQKTRHVGAYALAGRIRADYTRLQGALHSYGYYAGHIEITVTVADHTLSGDAPDLASLLAVAKAGETVKIQIGAQLGPRFTIGHVTVQLDGKDAQHPLSEQERQSMGVEEGKPAIAADVLAAQGKLLSFLQNEGYALASVQSPQAFLRPEQREIDVLLRVERGPKVLIGPLHFRGLAHVKPSYIQRRLNIKEGQLYQASAIETARLDLGSTGLFSTVQEHGAGDILSLSAENAHKAAQYSDIAGALPLTFDFIEVKPRRVTGDIGYSTDLGGRAGVTWLHRNLFGSGERLKLVALATGLGGTAQQGIGYDLYADYTKPDFERRDQALNFRAEIIRQLLYSYGQTALLLRGGLSRPIGKDISGSSALLIEQEKIRQFGRTRQYFIASIPLQLDFDGTHRSSPLEPAREGGKLLLGMSPSLSLGGRQSFYLPLHAEAAVYFDFAKLHLTKAGNSILALRGEIGSVQGASTWNLPPDQRLYAGGPGSVRGFRYQGVGPQYGDTKYAIGGTAMDAATVEFRQRLPKNFGLASFIDAGQVSSHSIPGHGTLHVGYGGGVRYFTPIGPIRVDVAFPLNRPERGDKWELYFGLGETF